MRSEVDSKRNKFAKQIRQRQHQQYFQMHRQAQSPDLPAIAYLPILIDNELYPQLEAILDQLEPYPQAEAQQQQQQQQKLSEGLLASIRDRSQYHADQAIRLLMFKLINRLGKWTQKDISYALKLLREGKVEVIKELAIYVEVIEEMMERLGGQNQIFGKNQNTQKEKKKKEKLRKQKQEEFIKLLQEIFPVLLDIKITQPQLHLCWLDLICKSLQLLPKSVEKINATPDFLISLDFPFNFTTTSSSSPTTTPPPQYHLIRIFRIVTKLCPFPQYQPQIPSLPSFPLLLTLIKQGSIEIVIEGLEIVAELMSADDGIVGVLVEKFAVMGLLGRFVEHVLVGVQMRVLWAVSNVAASECYGAVLGDTKIMDSLFKKAQVENRPEIRIQAYCCLLNLFSNLKQPELQTLHSAHPELPQLLITTLHESEHQPIRDILLQRSIFSIYHLIQLTENVQTHNNNKYWIELERLGVKKIVNGLYMSEKEEKRVGMLGALMDLLETKGKQHEQMEGHENGHQLDSKQ